MSIDNIAHLINIMYMNIKQMEVLRAVMNTGSITGAAALLHVTPPGISRMMKHLQLRLGVPLFEKQGNRLVATADARRLHSEIERVYSGIEQVSRVAQELKSGAGQQLNVICSPSVAAQVGPKAVAHMLRQYPDLQMRIEVQPVYDIYQTLLSQQCDLAISLVPIEHPNLHKRLLAMVGLVAVVPAQHALAAKKKLQLKDLAHIPLIRFPEETTQGATLNRLLAGQNIQVQSRVTVKTARDACALAAEGVGAAVIDTLTAQHLNDPRIVKLPLNVKSQFAVTALWSKDWPMGKLAQEFVDFVARQIKETLHL
jgi:DNA-binding transcriptional LysR family regulator